MVRFFALSVGLVCISGVMGCGGDSSSSSDSGGACSALKIAGGEECSVRPLSVALVATNFGYCTGTFITSRHVLTAAHCIPPRGQQILVVTKGFSTQTTRAVKHPLFTSFGISPYDVAIVTIGEDAPVSPAPIELSIDVESGDKVAVYGYGLDQEGNDVIQRVEEGGISLKATFLDVESVSDDSVKTLSDGSGDTCTGDSGGPLVRKGSNGEFGVVAIVRAGPNVCVADIGIASDNSNIQAPIIRDFVLAEAPGARLN